MVQLLFLFFAIFMSGALCRSSLSPEGSMAWDSQRVEQALLVLSQQPHPVGSERQATLTKWLQGEAEKIGLEVTVDPFTIQVPDPTLLGNTSSMMQKTTVELTARNVYAKHKVAGADCVVILGSHYDSKRLDGMAYVGANDSGSSSAALLELMRQLKSQPGLGCSVLAMWFDGEEAWLQDWRDGQDRHPARQQDNLYGSRHASEQLQTCADKLCLPARLGGEKVKALVLLDMIGMPNVQLTIDSFSDRALMEMARQLDKSLFEGSSLFARPYPKPIEDDHRPFIERGVPSINLIDFENLQTWHQPSDTISSLDLRSIEKVSRLAMALLLKIAEKP